MALIALSSSPGSPRPDAPGMAAELSAWVAPVSEIPCTTPLLGSGVPFPSKRLAEILGAVVFSGLSRIGELFDPR